MLANICEGGKKSNPDLDSRGKSLQTLSATSGHKRPHEVFLRAAVLVPIAVGLFCPSGLIRVIEAATLGESRPLSLVALLSGHRTRRIRPQIREVLSIEPEAPDLRTQLRNQKMNARRLSTPANTAPSQEVQRPKHLGRPVLLLLTDASATSANTAARRLSAAARLQDSDRGERSAGQSAWDDD